MPNTSFQSRHLCSFEPCHYCLDQDVQDDNDLQDKNPEHPVNPGYPDSDKLNNQHGGSPSQSKC
ncbi:hypothetical protein MTBBW1_1940058 [Desulfamplus magnetovallimortis]|uniref:Uncharacterized protein n=1 Tax=Desulfamplus magnetovallimortis TaxID=1246637 RepID=A0A1W1HB55_9BACT|nr:hypothetical protein [Desulfamplus magnetovallimortis]SLM29731.1 hypothetical protein MTBBW1_1940058 [Desulfamplus magnetovallimortis]